LFQAEDGIRDFHVTGVQTCALPISAILTTASFLPQAWLTYRTHDVSGISLAMYSAFTVGVALSLVDGLALGSWPMTVANGITLSLALGILLMKLRFRAGR